MSKASVFKKLSKTIKANVVCISSYKKRNIVKPYTKIDDDWLEITRANDPEKILPEAAARLMGKIAYELHKNNDRPVFLSTHWFEKVTKKKRHQNSRLRKQINHIYHFTRRPKTFQDGEMLYNVFEICYTSEAFKIMNLKDVKIEQTIAQESQENKLQACSINAPTMEQKSYNYIDNKVIEEIPIGSLSMTNNEKLKIKKINETENTTCSNAFLTEHSQVAIHKTEPNQVDKSDHLNQPKLLTVSEEIPAMKQDNQNIIPDKETRQMLLSKALWSAFGAAANEIQDNCMFEELEPDRVGIKPSLGVSFNDIEKAKIRKCIKSVYGEEVKILAAITKPLLHISQLDNESELAKSEVLESSAHNNSQWLRFKASVNNSKLRHILNHPALKTIEVSNRIIIETYTFLIDRITSEHLQDLEDAVFKTGLTLEFHEKTVASDYVIRDKKTIVLSREKILKDQEWKTNTPDALDDLINELKNEEKLT